MIAFCRPFNGTDSSPDEAIGETFLLFFFTLFLVFIKLSNIQRDRQTDRQTDRQRQRDRETETERETRTTTAIKSTTPHAHHDIQEY